MRTVDPEQWPVGRGRTRLVGAPPSLSPRETRLRASLVDAAREFWRCGPIRGYQYVQEAENNKLRWVYLCLLTCAVACGVAVSAASECELAARQPIATSRLAGGLQLRHFNFPAVALCPSSLVSRAALRDYARYLSELDGNRTYARWQLERHLAAFGALSEMVRAPADFDVRFAGFLAALGQRNISDIAYRLAPRCSAMLEQCTWRARVVPCTRLFAERATPHGYCCAFNARYQAEDALRPALRLAAAGRDGGLGFVVHQNSADFTYVRRPVAGLEVMIWEGSEYPVPEGGGVVMSIVPINASVYLTLSARKLLAHSNLRDIADHKRGCRMPRASGGTARDSLAWCLQRCRVAAVRVLCACTPHLYKPLYPNDDYESCSLDHLQCLNKYKEMLESYILEETEWVDAKAREREPEVGLRCPHCLRDCERVQYEVHSVHSEHRHLHKLFQNILSRDVSSVNTSVIRVYFARSDQELLVAEVNIPLVWWFQDFATHSSPWVCLAGMTTVTVLQLLYHASLRWRHHYNRRARRSSTRPQRRRPPRTTLLAYHHPQITGCHTPAT